MLNEKVEGIVLRSVDYQERQRILSVFTPDLGMLSLIVKGLSVKKPHLLLLTTPLVRGEFCFARGTSELGRFRDGTVIDSYEGLRQSISQLEAAAECAKILLQSQLPGKAAPQLYHLLRTYLKEIAKETFDFRALVASFYLKILKHEGLLGDVGAEEGALLKVRTFSELKSLSMSEPLLAQIRSYFKSKITT